LASEKQIIANRINARKGGVKTAAGKKAVRLNAVSYGIFSNEVLLPGEDAKLLSKLRENLITEFDPQGEMETIIVERIISSTWRLKRMLRSETMLSSYYLLENDDPKVKGIGIDYRYDPWQLLYRLETTIENQIYKSINALERLQRARLGDNIPPPLVMNVNLADNPALAAISGSQHPLSY
jgi:23S rRNA G2069 N7-methylase RlmK/C1962 C5-methylase RlmI